MIHTMTASWKMYVILSMLFKPTKKIEKYKSTTCFYCTLAVSLLRILVLSPAILIPEFYVLLEDVVVRVMHNSHL